MNVPCSSKRFEDRLDLRFQSFEGHVDASLDRFEREFLRRLDEQFAAQTFTAVVAIVGTSLSVGLVLIAAWL